MGEKMKKNYWFPTALPHWGEEERAAMARVIESGRFTMGEETEAFEEELAAFNHRKHAVAVNSGSSANLIAVGALMYMGNDSRSAIVPALAWATTYAPLIQHGFSLLLDDCDNTWCSAPYRSIVHKSVPLIVNCSILGNPSQALDWYINTDLNDDCESLGATLGGRPTGSYGTIATQSFFYSHQLSAIEGGACLTDDDGLALTMRMLRDHGSDRSVRQEQVPFDKEYNFELFGYNVRPVEMHMAVAREQLKKLPTQRTERRKNWTTFLKATEDLPIRPAQMDLMNSNPFGLHFELEDPKFRPGIAVALRANGIDCRLPTGGSFHLHPYGRMCSDQETPRADQIHRCGMFLGNAPYDISDKIERAAAVMRGMFFHDR